VWRLSDDPRRFEPGARLLHEDGRHLVVEASRVHKDRFLVKFAGSSSRQDAEGLRGDLFVLPGEVRQLEADEYWPQDLIGCQVRLVDGQVAGSVAGITPGAAHDLLAVATPRGERLVPLVQAIVVKVDVGARQILLDPPEGLLD
jgi:16S rRNA processing protein RimM